MKILQIIREEIVPLSRKQTIVLLTIIACIFQFAFFYAPALADEAVQQADSKGSNQEMVITNDSVIKDVSMDPEAAKLTTSVDASTPQTASSTPKKVDKVLNTSTHVMTAYNSEVGQTDDDPCTTANGFNLCKHGIEDTIAANFLPMGTKVKIPELFGDRIFVVRDRMNQKHPTRVDVWMKDHQSAMNFGVKVAKIQVIE